MKFFYIFLIFIFASTVNAAQPVSGQGTPSQNEITGAVEAPADDKAELATLKALLGLWSIQKLDKIKSPPELGYWASARISFKKDPSAFIRNFALLIGGFIGLALAWIRTNTAQQGHITDRFSKASEQLGSEFQPVRIGGIYALWRLSEDSAKRDAIPIWNILCAFVRNPTHEPDRNKPDKQLGKTKEPESPTTRQDVQIILDLFRSAYFAKQRRVYNYKVDLSGANLSFAILSKASLSGANLSGADLTYADLSDTNLTSAKLSYTNLSHANLNGANLNDADLSDANLDDAYMLNSNLRNASLRDAKLRSALLSYSDLRNAGLNRASLTRAILIKANLSEAYLRNTDLKGADLSGVNLRAARSLNQDMLNFACFDGITPPRNLPKGLTWNGVILDKEDEISE